MWYYQGREFLESDINNFFGYVYIITSNSSGRKYIGKKFFSAAKTKQINGKKKKTRISSNWLEYYGSNKELQEEVVKLGAENFHREILHLCKTRSECSYLETLEIFRQGALLGNNFYNEWCSCKIRKAHLKNISINPI